MNDNSSRFTRRSVAIGGGIAVALGLAAVGVNAPRWFRAKTAYDDLLDQLVDREAAVRIGRDVQDIVYHTPGPVNLLLGGADGLADEMRKRLNGRKLRDVTQEELAQGRLVEVRGWVMPVTLVVLCLLAAKAS